MPDEAYLGVVNSAPPHTPDHIAVEMKTEKMGQEHRWSDSSGQSKRELSQPFTTAMWSGV